MNVISMTILIFWVCLVHEKSELVLPIEYILHFKSIAGINVS